MPDSNDLRFKGTHRPTYFVGVDFHIGHILGVVHRMKKQRKGFDEVITDMEVAIIESFLSKIKDNCRDVLKELIALDNPDIAFFQNEKFLKKRIDD